MPRHRQAVVFILLLATLAPSAASARSQERQTDTLLRILDLYRLNRCPEAVRVMQPFVDANPNNIEVRLLLADCYMRTENRGMAASQYQAILTLAPVHVDALNGLRRAVAARQIKPKAEEPDPITLDLRNAEGAIQRGDLIRAQTLLERVISAQPSNTPARQRLAEVYSLRRRFQNAVAQYRMLLSDTRLGLESQLQIARNQEWAGNFADAARSYQEFLQRRPGDPEARRALANVLLWSAQYREAEVEYRRLLDAGISNNDVPLALAECYEHLSRPDSALEMYEAVLQSTPAHPTALEARDRIQHQLQETRRSEGYRQIEAGNLQAALDSFLRYLREHPESDETALEIARLYSWMQQYPQSIAAYRQYLDKNASDAAVRRELARLLMWTENYSQALQEFEALVAGPSATVEDYEQLIQISFWRGSIEAAAAYGDKLRQRDAGNIIAANALNLRQEEQTRLQRESAEGQRLASRTAADTLSAAGRYKEAIDAYTRYMSEFGVDRNIELTIARLYGWSGDSVQGRDLYAKYLSKYPDDLDARFELGNIESWSSDFAAAKADYQAVLNKDPRNVAAQTALALARDYAGDDRVAVLDQFKNVLAIDPANVEARNRTARIRLEVAPAASYAFDRTTDSDGLERRVNTFATTFTFRGGVRLSPWIIYSEFDQNRLLTDPSKGSAEANTRIQDISGSTHGSGEFMDLSVERSHWSIATRGGTFRYQSSRYLPQAEVNLEFRPQSVARVQLDLRRWEASSELNTIAAVVARMVANSAELLYQQQIGNRLVLTASAGMTQYLSSEEIAGAESRSRRGMARLDFRALRNFSIGYVGRLNRYNRQSPLYFSPAFYDIHGIAYRLSTNASRPVSLTIDGEIGRSRLPSTKTIEATFAGRLGWRMRPSVELRGLYRWGRSARSAFGSTVYRMDSFELTFSKIF
jgi:tetratricopeptide (TPR) repeat protein